MTDFILYQLKAGFCLMMFSGLYFLWLRKETFHTFNRYYLVISLLLSFIIPLIRLRQPFAAPIVYLPDFMDAVAGYPVTAAINPEPGFRLTDALNWSYAGLSGAFTLFFLLHIGSMLLLIWKNGFSIQDGYRIVSLKDSAQSYSFFNIIFINPAYLSEEGYGQVLKHEMAHARQYHSADILLLQVVRAFQWFNPFYYFTAKALKETHEYLADGRVLEQDGRPDRYKLLLLAQVLGVRPGIFNFFNHSLIKNRIVMMTKVKSPPPRKYKYLAVIPVVLLLVLLNCREDLQTAVAAEAGGISSPPQTTAVQPASSASDVTTLQMQELESGIDPGVGPEQALTRSVPDATETNEHESGVLQDPVFIFTENPASFQDGGIDNFMQWVQEHLVYPADAIAEGIFGRVTVQFVVSSSGKVSNVVTLRGVSPSLDAEARRVILSSPDWKPATQGGKAVNQQFTIPVIFTLSASSEESPPPPPIPGTSPFPSGQASVQSVEPTFVFVENQATFQGGTIDNFNQWVQKHLVYPADAKAEGVFGRVVVQFVVSSSGKVNSVVIMRGVYSSLDAEVRRVILSSPDWEPATQGGRAVAQQFNIPVVFTLTE